MNVPKLPAQTDDAQQLVQNMRELQDKMAKQIAGVPVRNATTISVGVEANCPRPGRLR